MQACFLLLEWPITKFTPRQYTWTVLSRMFKRYLSRSFLLLATYFFSANSSANSFEVMTSVFHFNYKEFDTSGELLDKETGYLPGIKFKYSSFVKHDEISVYISIHEGQVDYAGKIQQVDYAAETQNGTPHQTKTNQHLFKAGIQLKSRQSASFPVRLLFTYTYNIWDRDILTKNNILGLHERYSWDEFSLGLNFEGDKSADSFYWADVSTLLIYDPKMLVYLEHSEKKLDLGVSLGIRFLAGKTWQMNNKHSLIASISTEYFEFGRSNSIFTNDFFGHSVFTHRTT